VSSLGPSFAHMIGVHGRGCLLSNFKQAIDFLVLMFYSEILNRA